MVTQIIILLLVGVFFAMFLCVFCLPYQPWWKKAYHQQHDGVKKVSLSEVLARWAPKKFLSREAEAKVVGTRRVVYGGLGNEPVWQGKVPIVSDYKCPRYVYENLVETEKPDKTQGRIIGYRISPSLVIHSMVGAKNCWDKDDSVDFVIRYDGKYLTKAEAKILLKNWDAVSKMRIAAGDTPLPPGKFWIKEDKKIVLFPGSNDSKLGNIILKREIVETRK